MKKPNLSNRHWVFTLFLLTVSVPFCAWTQTPADKYQEAVAQYQQGKYTECVASLKDAVGQDPAQWRAYQLMGNAYTQLKDPRSALGAYEQSLGINPSNQALKEYTDKLRASLQPVPMEANASPPSPPAPAPTPLPAAPGKKSSLYFFGGSGLPLSPDNFSNSRSPGYSGGFGYEIQMDPSFALQFEAQDSTFAVNQANFPGLSITGGEVSSALLLVNGKVGFVPSDQAYVPYALVGLGLSFFNSNALTAVETATQQTATTPAASEMGFACRLGLGFEFKVGSGALLFIDADGVGTTGAYGLMTGSARSGLKLEI
jgi:tetratricopeptide (TPR) repeat protein